MSEGESKACLGNESNPEGSLYDQARIEEFFAGGAPKLEVKPGSKDGTQKTESEVKPESKDGAQKTESEVKPESKDGAQKTAGEKSGTKTKIS